MPSGSPAWQGGRPCSAMLHAKPVTGRLFNEDEGEPGAFVLQEKSIGLWAPASC